MAYMEQLIVNMAKPNMPAALVDPATISRVTTREPSVPLYTGAASANNVGRIYAIGREQIEDALSIVGATEAYRSGMARAIDICASSTGVAGNQAVLLPAGPSNMGSRRLSQSATGQDPLMVRLEHNQSRDGLQDATTWHRTTKSYE